MARYGKGKSLKSIMAIADMERLGVNPIEKMLEGIEELKRIKEMNIKAYESGRGYGEKSDAGPAYLSNAVKAAGDIIHTYSVLAKFRYPTLSAVAIKSLDDDDSRAQPMTTEQAMQVIRNDPFFPKTIDNNKVIEAMRSDINAPLLPKGEQCKS